MNAEIVRSAVDGDLDARRIFADWAVDRGHYSDAEMIAGLERPAFAVALLGAGCWGERLQHLVACDLLAFASLQVPEDSETAGVLREAYRAKRIWIHNEMSDAQLDSATLELTSQLEGPYRAMVRAALARVERLPSELCPDVPEGTVAQGAATWLMQATVFRGQAIDWAQLGQLLGERLLPDLSL